MQIQNQTSPEHLTELLRILEETTNDLHTALIEKDAAENSYKTAKTKVDMIKNKKDLIKEKIMAEKVLIREMK